MMPVVHRYRCTARHVWGHGASMREAAGARPHSASVRAPSLASPRNTVRGHASTSVNAASRAWVSVRCAATQRNTSRSVWPARNAPRTNVPSGCRTRSATAGPSAVVVAVVADVAFASGDFSGTVFGGCSTGTGSRRGRFDCWATPAVGCARIQSTSTARLQGRCPRWCARAARACSAPKPMLTNAETVLSSLPFTSPLPPPTPRPLPPLPSSSSSMQMTLLADDPATGCFGEDDEGCGTSR